MSTLTPNYGWELPAVNDPTDQDLWGGMLNSNISDQDTVVKGISDVADQALIAAQLPVGSLYFNADVATNPGTLLGYGTWVAFGGGRVPLGVGTGTDANGHMESFALGDTGGEYEHAQIEAEVGPHVHVENINYIQDGFPPTAQNGAAANQRVAGVYNMGTTAQNQASATAMPWMQPYVTVHIWKRSA